MQLDLFQSADEVTKDEPEVTYVPDLVPDHRKWFDYLNTNVTWNTRLQSRKTVTFGASYNYRKGTRKNREMPEFLSPICAKIEQEFGFWPNNCLINNYPDGNHYISYHSDQDLEMKQHTGVAIVSLGAVREMTLRKIDDHTVKFYYPLQSGSVFYMEDRIQKIWQHGVLKRSGCGHRISLSFRLLHTE